MLRLAAQPAEEGALEQLGVEPVGLGAPVIPLHRNASGADDMGLDATRPQPAHQPSVSDQKFPVRLEKFPVRLEKFPVMLFREFGKKARELRYLDHMNRRFAGKFAKIPCFFPV